ncbi:MAG: M42 family peptidase [Oscillospiraceae bacterium]
MENDVANAIMTRLKGKCELKIDNVGNVIAFKKGKKTPKNKIMLSAHMDEIGFMVRYIEDNGFIRFTTCGDIDPRVVVGRAVVIGKNKVVGVIGTKAMHVKTADERSKTYEFKDLYIDIGAKDKAEAEKYVKLSDRATFRCDFVEFGEDLVRCKAIDNRAGCAVLINLIENFDEYDVNYAFTVQEETGCMGGRVAANTINPDIAVIVETTEAGDIPGTSEDKVMCKLGGGPVIYFKDKATIYNHELYTFFVDKAEEFKMPCQIKAGVEGKNESRLVQVSNGGIKVAAVSIPCRYLHSASCTMKKEDLNNTYELLQKMLSPLAEF